MSSRARKILEDAYSLTPSDRALLAGELADVGDDEPEEVRAAWVQEAVRRLEQAERGEVELVSWEDVRARVRRTLETRSA